MKIDPTRLYMQIYTVVMTVVFIVVCGGVPVIIVALFIKLITWLNK